MRTSVIAVALTLAVGAPLTAQAKTRTVEFNRIVGDTATAEWDYSDGDVVTYVNVVVTRNNVTDNQSGKSKDAFVSLAISQSSISTGNVIITGSGYTSDFDFTVDKDLKMGTLHAKDVIFQDDNSFTFFNVDIDLNWTATAAATSSASHDHVHSPGLLMLSMFKGEFRDASAAGSIFGKDIQFAPTPSTQGQLQHNKFGTVTITTGKP
jgi:hypothetical protein